jgi:DNA topoisomerase I
MPNTFQTKKGIILKDKDLRPLIKDAKKCAEAVDLIYVKDAEPGIKRLKKGKNFIYVSGKRRIKGRLTLQRINRIVIPPAWDKVWICPYANGHLQATGLDVKKRKQYKYHPRWNSLRNFTKFCRLRAFGQAITCIRHRVNNDLKRPDLQREKILALLVKLMENTSIRVGNDLYEKLYGSFGLTTLKNKHVKVLGDKIRFSFKGKKGVLHDIEVRNRQLAQIIESCRELPGSHLFQYLDEGGKPKSVDAAMLNEYLGAISKQDFTAKDFRTWSGSVICLKALKEMAEVRRKSDAKKNIISALDQVAAHLGNTRAVCRKYYVHPTIINLYESNQLEKFLKKKNNNGSKIGEDNVQFLSPEEKMLMELLRKENALVV